MRAAGAPATLAGTSDAGAEIGTLGWILVAAAAWLVVATLVGLLVGLIVRERDRQVPPADPTPRRDAPASGPRRVLGRGRSRRT